MAEAPRSSSTEILHISASGERNVRDDWVSEEQPLEIRIKGHSVAITMRTPGHDRELAAGFALSEGLIQSADQLVDVAHCQRDEAEHPENIINLFLRADTQCDLSRLTRHVFASSSCGICGKASIEAIQSVWSPVASSFSIDATLLLSLPARLHAAQTQFQQTGGLHGAAIFDEAGQLLCLREDVGRHNAVDKVLGWSVLNGYYPLQHHLLLVSGRTSFEIMQKALAGRIPMIAGVSAPSSLAVRFAEENGQTLVGFLRESGFNVYTHRHRVHD